MNSGQLATVALASIFLAVAIAWSVGPARLLAALFAVPLTAAIVAALLLGLWWVAG